jgi:hypothetical protein
LTLGAALANVSGPRRRSGTSIFVRPILSSSVAAATGKTPRTCFELEKAPAFGYHMSFADFEIVLLSIA